MATRSPLRWAMLVLALARGSAERQAVVGSPVACTSHNDCLGVRGNVPHACFFNTVDKAGFCFPMRQAAVVAAYEGSSFLEIGEHQEGTARGATGGAGESDSAVKDVEGTASEVMAKMESGSSASAGSGSGSGSSTPTTMGDGRLVLHAEQGQSAMLDLASGESEFQIGNKGGTFLIAASLASEKNRPSLVIDPKGDVAFNVPNLHANSLTAESHLAVNGVPQWRVVVYDDYDAPSGSAKNGWSANALPSPVNSVKAPTLPIGISKECGVAMLGGPGIFNQAGSVSKVFNVGKDVKRVRVVAYFHFIDDWSGQSGYVKASTLLHGEDGAKMGDAHAVWTRQYAVVPRGASGSAPKDKVAALNVCGNPDIGEHLFSSKVDTYVPVVGGKLKLTFGSTWELQNGGSDSLPCSWGVSGLQLLVRY